MSAVAFALLVFLWEYPLPHSRFLLILESVESITGIRRVLVAGVVPSDCAALPTAQADTYCTSIACPGLGQFRATIEALDQWHGHSNTITFRVRDHACTQVEGINVVPGPYTGPRIPPAQPCQSLVQLPPPPAVTIEVPGILPLPLTIAQPHTVAPVIPVNPQVIAKVPHTTIPAPLTMPEIIPMPPRGVTDPPPARTVRVPGGPLEARPVPLPIVEPPGVPCP
jgi:hypothetical protein